MASIHRAICAAFRYYWRLFRTAFRHSFAAGDNSATIFAAIATGVFKAIGYQDFERTLGDLTWDVLVGVSIAFFIARLIAAPYWMFKEDEAKRRAEQAKGEERLAELEMKRSAAEAERDRADNSLRALSDLRETRARQRACLAELMDRGNALQNQFPLDSGQANEWMRQYGEWSEQIKSKVEQAFSSPHATKLLALRIDLDPKRTFAGGGKHQEAHARVRAIMDELHRMFPMTSTTE